MPTSAGRAPSVGRCSGPCPTWTPAWSRCGGIRHRNQRDPKPGLRGRGRRVRPAPQDVAGSIGWLGRVARGGRGGAARGRHRPVPTRRGPRGRGLRQAGRAPSAVGSPREPTHRDRPGPGQGEPAAVGRRRQGRRLPRCRLGVPGGRALRRRRGHACAARRRHLGRGRRRPARSAHRPHAISPPGQRRCWRTTSESSRTFTCASTRRSRSPAAWLAEARTRPAPCSPAMSCGAPAVVATNCSRWRADWAPMSRSRWSVEPPSAWTAAID